MYMNTITSDDVVQGEKLQSIASLTIMTPGYISYVKRYAIAVEYLCLPGNHNNFDKLQLTNDHLEVMKRHASLFVFGTMALSFFRDIAPRLTHSYVLIIHNSDENIDERYRQYINMYSNIVCVFAQNAMIIHPRLEALPIGIANTMWPHGNTECVARTRVALCDVVHAKDKLCYIQFNQHTNSHVRKAAWTATKYFGNAPMLGYPEYLKCLARHHYAVCPIGNGADTHRFWECLYVGTIPIVLEGCSLIEHWKRIGLPMLIVKDWEQITPTYLEQQKNKLYQCAGLPQLPQLRQLTMKYWRDRVKSSINHANTIYTTACCEHGD